MGNGYTRQSSSEILTNEVIEASDFNDEFNAIQDSFDGSTGHSHDGSLGEGPKISLTSSISGILPITNGGISAIHNIAGGRAPRNTDDENNNYGPGSLWIDTTRNESYICSDGSAANAVWNRIDYTEALDDISELNPLDGRFIVGDGNNWVTEFGNTARLSLGLGLEDSPKFESLNIGNSTDTNVSRISAGRIAVDNDPIIRESDVGTIASQNSNSVSITGGSISGISDLAVEDGGTGSSTAAGARSNLGANNASNLTAGQLAVARGGTGASTEAGARTSLGFNNASNINDGSLSISYGGTGATDLAGARSNLGVNDASNITAGQLPIARGGTGASTLAGAITSLGINNASNLTTGSVPVAQLSNVNSFLPVKIKAFHKFESTTDYTRTSSVVGVVSDFFTFTPESTSSRFMIFTWGSVWVNNTAGGSSARAELHLSYFNTSTSAWTDSAQLFCGLRNVEPSAASGDVLFSYMPYSFMEDLGQDIVVFDTGGDRVGIRIRGATSFSDNSFTIRDFNCFVVEYEE